MNRVTIAKALNNLNLRTLAGAEYPEKEFQEDVNAIEALISSDSSELRKKIEGLKVAETWKDVTGEKKLTMFDESLFGTTKANVRNNTLDDVLSLLQEEEVA